MDIVGINVTSIGIQPLQHVKRRERMYPCSSMAVITMLAAHGTGARAGSR